MRDSSRINNMIKKVNFVDTYAGNEVHVIVWKTEDADTSFMAVLKILITLIYSFVSHDDI